MKICTQFGCPIGEDLEKPSSAGRGKPVATGHKSPTREVTNLYVAPVPEALRQSPIGGLVSLLEVVEGLIREDDSKPEGISRLIALEHFDIDVRLMLLEKYGQVEAGGAPSNADHPHDARLSSLRIPTPKAMNANISRKYDDLASECPS